MSGRSETAEGQRLSVRNLTKRFGSITAIESVNLDVAKGEIRALCGGNGAGKSTLVKLLTGVLTPSSGSIVIENTERKFKNPVDAQRAGLSLVAQELSLAPDLSVHDNLWLGHADAPLRRKTSATIERATAALTAVGLGDVAINTKVSTLGLAQRQLLEIARGIVRNASVLILDEPTATLSEQEIKTVFATVRRLRDQGCSIIYITHRMAEVYDLCDTVTVMRNGQVITTSSVNSLNRGELLDMMIGRKLNDVYPVPTSPPGADILTVRNLSVPGNLSDFNLDLRAGEIVGIVGQIGSGAIESIRALAGLEHHASGDVRVRGNPIQLGKPHHALNSGMRFVSEDRAAEGIFLDLTSHENLVSTRLNELHRRGVVSPRSLKSVASKLAVSVGFDRNRLHLESGRLSGGNQQKLAVGRCIDRAGTGVVLMNEPTRGVDMGARAEIYETLRKLCEQGNAVLLASTDLEEVVGLVDRIVTLYRGRLVGTHTRGDLSETKILAEITNSKEAA